MPIPYKTQVITANPTRDLTVLATVKLELGITNTDNDDWLQLKIGQASDAIAKACNRKFQQETVKDFFRVQWGERGAALLLSRIPVTSIASVMESTTVLDPTNYEFDENTGMLWRRFGNLHGEWIGWNWCLTDVVVQYTGGFELLATVPFDLEQACVLLIKQSWFARTRDPLVKSVSIPGVASYDYLVGGSASAAGGFSPEVAQLIAPYRLHIAL